MRNCTCVGSCRGADGLGEGWVCALEAEVEATTASSPDEELQRQQLLADHSVALEFVRELASWSTLIRDDDRERDAILRARKWLHADDKKMHDQHCETELTSHGYTPCRCHERSRICYCRKNPCVCLPAIPAQSDEQSVDAVDPHLQSEGTPSTREKAD